MIDAYAAQLVQGPAAEPITVEQLEALGRLDRPDERELYPGFIAAARDQVERDIDWVLVDQVWDAFFPAVAPGEALRLPKYPATTLVTIRGLDANGLEVDNLDPTTWTLQGNLAWPTATGIWPAGVIWVIRAHYGVANPALLPPLLVQVIGTLAAHKATAGRDLVALGHIVAPLPFGYDEAITPFRRVTVA